MSNEVEKFDPAQMMQGVKDRIKATFVSLIPDDQWDIMCQKEIDDFFRQKDRSYNTNNRISDFGQLCQTELHNKCQSLMKEYLESPEFKSTWYEHGQPVATEAVKKMIVDNSGVILQNMFGGMAQAMIQNFANSINVRGF